MSLRTISQADFRLERGKQDMICFITCNMWMTSLELARSTIVPAELKYQYIVME